MSLVFDGASVAVHDFHRPEAVQQSRRDGQFWQAVRWALSGPEKPDALALPVQARTPLETANNAD